MYWKEYQLTLKELQRSSWIWPRRVLQLFAVADNTPRRRREAASVPRSCFSASFHCTHQGVDHCLQVIPRNLPDVLELSATTLRIVRTASIHPFNDGLDSINPYALALE
jgi:hypothetical protein